MYTPLPSARRTAFVLVVLSLLLTAGRTHAGVNQWTSHGPQGEDVHALAIDPQTPTTLYAGTNGAGVYKSIDGGQSWTFSNTGLTHTVVLALAIDPQTPTTLYAGTWGDGGVYKSTDGGQSWTFSNTGLTNTFVKALAIDPQTPTTLYAGTFGGVFKSIDRGQNWVAHNTGLTHLSVRALAIDPQTPTTLYAGGEYDRVFKSTDGGQSWVVHYTEPTHTIVLTLAIDPQTPTTLYAGTENGGVFKSTDGGQNWVDYNTGLTHTFVPALAIDPQTPTTLYAGTGNGGVFKSIDGGKNWTAHNTGLTHTFVPALAIDPQTPTTLYAGTLGGGVFVIDQVDLSQPVLSVTPPSLDFDSLNIGSSKDLPLTIQNTGGGTLEGSCSTSAPFSLPEGCSFSLPIGQQKQVKVRFSPTAVGTFMGNVSFISNGGTVSLMVKGEGVLARLEVDIWYIEVNQAVQRIDPNDLTNQIPLVAGKNTVVRAYIRNRSISQPDPTNVTGSLYKSPSGQNIWTPIGTLDPLFITAVKEPKPEILENTLNFRLPGGLPEGSYDLRVKMHRVSDPTVAVEKTIGVAFRKRKTLKVLYTKVNYKGDLPSGDFSNAYRLLSRVYPIAFDPKQWVADSSSLVYRAISSKAGCGGDRDPFTSNGTLLLARLGARMTAYNSFQPNDRKVDHIVGIVASSRLTEGTDGCSNKVLNAAFVTDKADDIVPAVAHEIGHLNGLPIPGRGKEEYPGGPEGIGYPIDQGFKIPTDRKHFLNFSDPQNLVTKRHDLFYNFMGLTPEINTWVDELTYDFLYRRLKP